MKKYLLLSLVLAVVSGHAQVPEKYRGHWLLVNGTVVLHVGESGAMSWQQRRIKDVAQVTDTATAGRLQTVEVTGKLDVSEDGSFVWQTRFGPVGGRFSDDKMQLESLRMNRPGDEMKWLEFRRIAPKLAGSIGEHLEQSPDGIKHLFEQPWDADEGKWRIATGVLNNLRQISAAAYQFYLEKGVSRATLDQLVGSDKYLTRINPVDGEDYAALKIRLGATWTITTQSGVVVRLQH